MNQEKRPPEWMTPEQKAQWEAAFGNLPKKKKSPTNELTSAIMKYMRSLRCAVARINTTGIYDEKIGKYRYSGSTNGVEDVNCILPVNIAGMKVGVTVAVEIKTGKDRMRDEQLERKENVEKAGGHYIIAKTFDQFKNEIDEIVHKYEYIAKRPGSS